MMNSSRQQLTQTTPPLADTVSPFLSNKRTRNGTERAQNCWCVQTEGVPTICLDGADDP